MDKILKYKWRALYLLLAVASFLAYGFLMKSFAVSKKVTLTIWNYLGLGLLAIVIVTAVWLIYLWELKRENSWGISKMPLWNKKSMLTIVVGVVIAYAVKMSISEIILKTTGGTTSNQVVINTTVNKTQWLFKIILVLIGPILEELIFRGMFFEIFFTKPTKTNTVLGIITSSILFGLMHEFSISWAFLAYFGMGCVLAYVYLHTKNIYADICVHIFINLPALLV